MAWTIVCFCGACYRVEDPDRMTCCPNCGELTPSARPAPDADHFDRQMRAWPQTDDEPSA